MWLFARVLHGATAARLAETANVVENKGFELPPGYCGSCYGAEEKDGDCCNTCDQVSF
jgi:hypothetical protein